MTPFVLLDSSVLIAATVLEHPRHAASARILTGFGMPRGMVAAHSYADAYAVLTRQGERAPFGFAPSDAWAALESLRGVTDLIGLTAAQWFDAVKRYAFLGGTGPQLHEALCGEVALVHDISTVVTWNTDALRGLFTGLTIVTPLEFSARRLAPRSRPV